MDKLQIMTVPDLSEITAHGIDTQALANLIIELNISRRNSRSYPKGHQVIDAALHKVLKTYAGLKETGDEIVIGVACDALLLGDAPLDKASLVYRDFARVLHERGIGALVLHRGLSLEELRSFIAILGTPREEIYAAGGIESVWEESGIGSLQIRAIRYDLFTATEEQRVGKGEPKAAPKGLWERFARGLVNGLLPSQGIDEDALDPELLAEALNQLFLSDGSDPDAAPDLAEFLLPDDPRQGSGPGAEAQAQLAYRKLAAFVGRLTPGLRRQFLNSSFDIKNAGSRSLAEGVIRQLSADVLIDTLEDINRNQVSVPPFIMGLLQQMSSHASGGAPSAQDISDEELREKMRTIFKEHAREEFIPDSYQQKLNRMMSADQIPLIGLQGVDDLMDTFEAAHLEGKTSDILLLLLRSGDTSEEGYAALAQNLHDILTFFLQTGDYAQLLKILRELGEERIPAGVRDDLMGLVLAREFLDEILDGLDIWGKAKFDAIAELVGEIGTPFIEVMLDRLAEADSMSLRRFLMDRLVEFGPAAGPAIIERLSDSRWYFLRNLIGVVRLLNLSSSAERLRTLSRNRDPRVGQEALKALLQFRDPEAEARIMRDLGGQSRELQLAAIRVAGKASSAPLLAKLHALLTGPGLSGKEYEVKNLVVQALGEIGAAASLQVLEGVLASRSIFHPVLSNRLKADVVGSLGRYPAVKARPILERIAQGRGGLAQQAQQVMENSLGRPS